MVQLLPLRIPLRPAGTHSGGERHGLVWGDGAKVWGLAKRQAACVTGKPQSLAAGEPGAGDGTGLGSQALASRFL